MTRFAWDRRKDAINVRKHGVSFDEARMIFLDPFLLTRPDPDHSVHEDRFISVGWSDQARLLTVVTSQRGHQPPRIISARRATKRERDDYARRRR